MPKRLKVAATGLSGLVGSRVEELLKGEFDFTSLPIEKMDITDRPQVISLIKNLDFDVFLHLAAYTNVDGAEKEKLLATKINVEGTKNVFEAVLRKGKKFIYISTDFVFDGENPPFFEDSTANPISHYGLTKYQAEQIVKNKAMIVRLSYPYRAYFSQKTDFVRAVIRLLKEKKPIKGVVDQIITFTFIDDIAYALGYLLKNFSPQVYHIVGADSLSAYQAMLTICDVFDLDKSLVGKTTYDQFYQGKAKRPRRGIIRSKKNDFYQMKNFEEGLRELKKQINS